VSSFVKSFASPEIVGDESSSADCLSLASTKSFLGRYHFSFIYELTLKLVEVLSIDVSERKGLYAGV